MDSFYSEKELQSLGFKSVGKNVKLSRKTSLYGVNRISIGDNTRIDDDCLLSGDITIGRNVHIAAGCYFFAGDAGIDAHDFVGTSSRTVIYAVTDDYSGAALTNPTIPDDLRNILKGKVVLHRHSLIGTSCVILPGVEIGEGCSVGALSLITKSLPEWMVCVGIPAKPLKERKRDILDLEKIYLSREIDG